MPGQLNLGPLLDAVTPEEAVAFFRQKGYRVGFDFRDVWQQEHQAAFTVAKATQVDLLKDIRGQVDRAIADGISFADFKRTLMPSLKARGWWGRRNVVDPLTGETVNAQLGSTRRLRTIFDANLSSAYTEGQWERIQANKGLFPFLEYGHSASEHPRLKHKAYAGTLLPADHPWWQTHMPVKEWGCKCPVYQHSAATMKREGLKVTDAPAEQMRTVTNKRTDEEMRVPVGVDPAFHYPLGGRRASLGRMMMDKADAGAALTTARVLADGAEQWAPLVDQEFGEFVGRYVAGERGIGTRRVVGALDVPVANALRTADALPQHATVAVDLRRMGDLVGAAGAAANQGRAELVATLPALLRRVGEVWLDGRRMVMLCTPDDDVGRVAQVVIDLDAPLRTDVGNSVRSVVLIDPRAFGRPGRRIFPAAAPITR